jgi:hypothetical protein
MTAPLRLAAAGTRIQFLGIVATELSTGRPRRAHGIVVLLIVTMKWEELKRQSDLLVDFVASAGCDPLTIAT